MLAETTKTQVISLTPAAVQAVRDLLEERSLEGYALRVFVSGSGCSGLQYGMALEGNIREQDNTSEFDDVKVVVDEVSIDYLRGATVDCVEDETGSGFKIDNPNALSSCGCGSSCGDEASASGCGSCH
jgi:iron-sulfur cluster assembly accessory protein